MSPTYEMSSNARFILQRLAKAEKGELVSYKTLADLIGSEVNGSTGALHTATRRALRDHDMVFAAVPGEGVKRLTDAEIVAQSEDAVQRQRRASRRAAEKLTKVDFGAITDDEKVRHNAHLSLFSSVAHISSRKQVEQIEAAVRKAGHDMPIAQTLKMFAAKDKS